MATIRKLLNDEEFDWETGKIIYQEVEVEKYQEVEVEKPSYKHIIKTARILSKDEIDKQQTIDIEDSSEGLNSLFLIDMFKNQQYETNYMYAIINGFKRFIAYDYRYIYILISVNEQLSFYKVLRNPEDYLKNNEFVPYICD